MLNKLNSKRAGFTLVEIMIVVSIIALLASIAVPNFLRARKRSQAAAVIEDLRMIDSCLEQYSMEHPLPANSDVAFDDLTVYMKAGSRLAKSGGVDTFGNNFEPLNNTNTVQVNDTTFQALSDVAPAEYWGVFKAN